MNILHTSRRQGGASAWTLIGSLLVVAGIAGLGVALIKPSYLTPSVAPVATGSTAALMTADTKPAAPTAAPTAVIKTDPPGSGPHPNWHGTWRGTTPDSKMVITGSGFEIFDVYENDGKKSKLHVKLPWVNTSEANGSDEQSGYAKSSVSIADISRRFEESVASFQRDPSDFSISDPTQSRWMIGRIKPGNYRVVWAYWGGDCGLRDMIIDGDLILSIVNCRYEHQISLFTREGAVPPAAAREVQGPAGNPVVPPLPGGRWEGTVNQPGFGSYPAVMQLQATSAGMPAGTMAYASLRCTASLSFMASEGNKVWFRESIQDGKGKCADGGRISITPMSNDSLLWQYFAPGNVSSPMATATFRR